MTPPLAEGLEHGGDLSRIVAEVAEPLHRQERGEAAARVAKLLGFGAVKNDQQAHVALSAFLQYLLDSNRYVDASTLLWAPSLFSGEPRSVRLIWDALFRNSLVMVPGAASMGKSYSIGVWAMLDWLRDPQYTNIKVVGPSEEHLKQNLFSHLVKLHRAASVTLPGEIRELEISLDSKEKTGGLFGTVVPIGPRAAGRLQGVKTLRRLGPPHPQFGETSRLRVILEEAELIPVGIWADITNTMANASDVHTFKVAAPFNPKDPNSQCAIRCEPLDGWESLDVETSEEWMSKRGWKVVRLDAHKSENVTQNKVIFPGMQTRRGLEQLTLNEGGVGTAGWFTMARGWYPPQGVDLAVIPQHLVQEIFGTYEFAEIPLPCAGVDVALEGGDNAIMVLGRTGLASGWRKPPVEGKEQPFIPFLDANGQRMRRPAIQVDQVFTLPKGDTVKLVNEIERVCKGAHIRGTHLAVDRTGNGAGVHDLLVSTSGFAATKGVNPSESPTEKRILEEDQKLPCDEYSMLLSELWFATRKFIEFGMVKFSPNIPRDPVIGELTGRRFLLAAKKTRVESKKDYRSRGNKSPDRADALTILIHAVRQNLDGPPSATGASGGRGEDFSFYEAKVGLTDRPDYL